MAVSRAVIGCLLLLVRTSLPAAAAEEDDYHEELRARVAEEMGEHIDDPAFLFNVVVSKEETIEHRDRQLSDSQSLLAVANKAVQDFTAHVEGQNSEIKRLKEEIDGMMKETDKLRKGAETAEMTLVEERKANKQLKDAIEDMKKGAATIKAMEGELETYQKRVHELESSIFPVWIIKLAMKADSFLNGRLYPAMWTAYNTSMTFAAPYMSALKVRSIALWKLVSPTLYKWWAQSFEVRKTIWIKSAEIIKAIQSAVESSKILETQYVREAIDLEAKAEMLALEYLMANEWARRNELATKETATYLVFTVIVLAAIITLYTFVSVISWGLRGKKQSATAR